MRNQGTAFLLTLLGLVGIAGVQHLYLGKYIKALLWFFTFGILGLGTIIDIFTISSQVDQHNTKQELNTIRAASLKK